MWALFRSIDRLNLKKAYLITLIFLLLMMVLLQLLNTQILHKHRQNIQLLEMTGRQQLLSQKIVKLALLTEREPSLLENRLHQISHLGTEWSQIHFNLKFGTDREKMSLPTNTKIDALITRLQPHKDNISDAINELLMVAQIKELRSESVDKLRMHEEPFLRLMDELVKEYQLETEKSIALWRKLKILTLVGLLLAVSMMLILSYKMLYSHHHAYAGQMPSDENEFFSITVADAFMRSQALDKRQKLGQESKVSVEGQVLPQNALINTPQRIKVLMVADASLPSDYIAWFLNKWEIDFSIVKSVALAHAEASAQTFDVMLMSEGQALVHQANYFFVEGTKAVKIPIVILTVADLKEIYTQIYEADPANLDTKKYPSALYTKIEAHLPKKTLGV